MKLLHSALRFRVNYFSDLGRHQVEHFLDIGVAIAVIIGIRVRWRDKGPGIGRVRRETADFNLGLAVYDQAG